MKQKRYSVEQIIAVLKQAGMEPTAQRRGRVFSVLGYMPAGFGGHYTVARRFNSSQLLLYLGEKGVYSFYTPFSLHLSVTISPSCTNTVNTTTI